MVTSSDGSALGLKRVGSRRHTLTELAYNELLDAILSRRLKPGDPLGLDQLARELGMSSTPINLALSRLQAEGLVAYKKHVGSVVRVLTPKELRDIYDSRLMCELHAVGVGLAAATDEEIERIASIHREMVSTADLATREGYRRYLDLDGPFHEHMAGLSHNDLTQEWFGRLYLQIRGMRLGVHAWEHQPIELALEEHTEIVAALSRRDSATAQAALRDHILRARDFVLMRLAASNGEAAPGGENGYQEVSG